MLDLDRIEADNEGLLQHSNEWRSRYWAETGPALIRELREARELLADWLVAVNNDPELSGTLIICAEKRTKELLGDQ